MFIFIDPGKPGFVHATSSSESVILVEWDQPCPVYGTDNTMAKRKRAIGQTTINKTLHGKLMIEQHESGVNSGAQEW